MSTPSNNCKYSWVSGAVFRCRCVFSKHKDIDPFLKAQAGIDAKKLEEATELTRRNTEKRKAGQGGGAER